MEISTLCFSSFNMMHLARNLFSDDVNEKYYLCFIYFKKLFVVIDCMWYEDGKFRSDQRRGRSID